MAKIKTKDDALKKIDNNQNKLSIDDLFVFPQESGNTQNKNKELGYDLEDQKLD
ncbi:MAG: hypothetical protein LBC17_02645 [Lactobacillaceae bacterium]|jgi:hypothetical protein|nr:hypothetical protein [Lactobacillaceae bacterium]